MYGYPGSGCEKDREKRKMITHICDPARACCRDFTLSVHCNFTDTYPFHRSGCFVKYLQDISNLVKPVKVEDATSF